MGWRKLAYSGPVAVWLARIAAVAHSVVAETAAYYPAAEADT
jgi:hypothetical protein